MKTAIIDGDIPVYTECSVAASRGNAFGEYFPNITRIADNVCKVVDEWRVKAECTDVIFVHSHKSRRNFRKMLLPDQYKVSRASEKPAGYYEVLDVVCSRYDTVTIDGVEGDDTCGILHTSDKVESVVISTDKDFRTLPGWLFNPQKHYQRELITPDEATHFWMLQVLMGDAADGYKGCRNVGRVKAQAALSAPHLEDIDDSCYYVTALWDEVLALYEKQHRPTDAGTPLSNAILQARMARILHRNDYDPVNNTINLWSPDGDHEVLNLADPRY